MASTVTGRGSNNIATVKSLYKAFGYFWMLCLEKDMDFASPNHCKRCFVKHHRFATLQHCRGDGNSWLEVSETSGAVACSGKELPCLVLHNALTWPRQAGEWLEMAVEFIMPGVLSMVESTKFTKHCQVFWKKKQRFPVQKGDYTIQVYGDHSKPLLYMNHYKDQLLKKHPFVFPMISIRFNVISTEKGMASASAFAFVPYLKVGGLEKRRCESQIRSASFQSPTSHK